LLVAGCAAGLGFRRALINRYVLDPAFSRDDEPLQFWFLTGLLLVGAVALLFAFTNGLISPD
jgi:hypothetical protein